MNKLIETAKELDRILESGIEILPNSHIHEKLKHLPFNFFFCLSSWFAPFLLITTWTNVSVWLAAGISFYIYLMDVRQSSENDYLEEKIKKLEDAQK